MGIKDLSRLKLLGVMILAGLLALPVSAASTKIYVWRNADGVLVFSDSPKPGAEEVEIKNPNIISSSIDTSILDINPKVIKDDYQVKITQPKNNATIRDNTGSVHVQGLIMPIFKQGLKIVLVLDGKPYQKPQSHSLFALRNIERGEHQIKMDLINNKGKVIASSPLVTFYMHRASVIKAK